MAKPTAMQVVSSICGSLAMAFFIVAAARPGWAEADQNDVSARYGLFNYLIKVGGNTIADGELTGVSGEYQAVRAFVILSILSTSVGALISYSRLYPIPVAALYGAGAVFGLLSTAIYADWFENNTDVQIMAQIDLDYGYCFILNIVAFILCLCGVAATLVGRKQGAASATDA